MGPSHPATPSVPGPGNWGFEVTAWCRRPAPQEKGSWGVGEVSQRRFKIDRRQKIAHEKFHGRVIVQGRANG